MRVSPKSVSLRLVAALFSLMVPGLGQFFGGRFRRGAIFFSSLVLLEGLGAAALALFPAGAAHVFAAWLILSILLRIWATVDALFTLRFASDVRFLPPGFPAYARLACCALFLVVWFVRPYDPGAFLEGVAHPFRMSTNARLMSPTLIGGDCVMVNTLWYREHPLVPGELVVFSGEKGAVMARVGDAAKVTRSEYRYAVPEGHVLLVNDNPEFWPKLYVRGAFRVERIIGRCEFIYWPPSRWGADLGPPKEGARAEQ